jgi:alpha-tubulin suppressor-like RCC1 family protein
MIANRVRRTTIVAGLTGAIALSSNGVVSGNSRCAACYYYSCALLADATVRCWGEDQDGELGNGATAVVATPAPVAVASLDGVAALVAGGGHVFATLADGTVAAWGANRCGELGDGTVNDAAQPVRVGTLEHVVGVSAGSCHACALHADGTVACWGDNGENQLGGGPGTSTTVSALRPVPVQL